MAVVCLAECFPTDHVDKNKDREKDSGGACEFCKEVEKRFVECRAAEDDSSCNAGWRWRSKGACVGAPV